MLDSQAIIMVKRKYVLIILAFLVVLISLISIFKPVKKIEIKIERLTNETASELSPTFSPDGKRIAFTIREYNESGVFIEIAVMDLKTKEIKKIFSLSDLQKVCEIGNIKNFTTLEIHRLAWSGNRIIFNTYCTFPITLPLDCSLQPIPEEVIKKAPDINKDKVIKMVMIKEDGSNPIIIGAGEHPYFSPDGRKIVYLYKSDFLVSVCGRCGKEIHILDLKSREDKLVYKQEKTLFWPTFSPDGKRIVFSRIEDEITRRNDIYVIDVEGNNLKKLTSYANNIYPTFSPDGKWIIFASNRDGGYDLYKLEIQTMKVEKVTNFNATYIANLNFSPDGKKLVFSMLHPNYKQGFDIWMMDWNK
jgi:Tol biopolymer transport system component